MVMLLKRGNTDSPYALGFSVLAASLLTGLVYWPGLGGGFLFDDHSNLSLLSRYGKVDDWESFWLYILSGFSGPTGRPIAHLSFLIDANHWPADPWPFKRTNLLLHIANGLLLFGLLRTLLVALGHHRRKAGWIALLATTAWMLHPFWVSTTLYVVQRMAQLATLFVLAGLWAWVSLRLHAPPRLTRRWFVLESLAILVPGLLAVLSKENGALLPALVVVLEVTVLETFDRRLGQTPSPGFRRFRWVLLGIPILLVALYMARNLPPLFLGDTGTRDFTPLERLLTQGRVLWDYIFQLTLPRPYPGGLFNDDIQLSTGLLTPWITAPAWLCWIVLAIGAWRIRTRHPAIAVTLLFFMVGHSLESTFVPLELHFEHRSYLPATLLFLPLALGWVECRWIPGDLRRAVPIGVVLALAVMTLMRADLWSSPYRQALQWAVINPESPRAQHHLASFWQETGNFEEAIRLNQRATQRDPTGLPWLITRVGLECAVGGDPDLALSRVESILARKDRVGPIATYQTEELLDYISTTDCRAFEDPESVLHLVDRLQDALPETGSESFKALLLQRRGRILLRLDREEEAYRTLQNLVATTNEPGAQLTAAGMLASSGARELALKLLAQPALQPRSKPDTPLGWVRRWYLNKTDYYATERDHLRETIRGKQDE